MVLEIFTKRKGAMQMKKKKCQSCGMSEYKQDGNVYTCIYCNAQYEESGGALKLFLNFTERQLDKMREASKEKNENHLLLSQQRKQEKLEKEERLLQQAQQRKKEKEEKEAKLLQQEQQRKKEKEEKALRRSRKRAGICQYCGHHFKGFFKKTCSYCGKAKDY